MKAERGLKRAALAVAGLLAIGIGQGAGAQYLMRDATRGAAIGAVGGAIAGDAGKGAAMGAVGAGLAGGMRRENPNPQQGAVPVRRAAPQWERPWER